MSARRSIDQTLANSNSKYNNHNATIHINMSASRRWQTPPPPSPCILNLPKPHPTRTRRLSKRYTNTCLATSSFRVGEAEEQQQGAEAKGRGKLVALFGEEREFAQSVPIVLVHPNAGHSPRRAKVILHKSHWRASHELELETQYQQQHATSSEAEAEGVETWGPREWKFEAEVLRAECNLLRMEKEVAVRRWEEASTQMQHALTMAHSLHSAVQTLVTGRKKIVDEKNAQVVLQTTLENQIQTLQSKLHNKSELSMSQTQLNKCSNFDRQAVFLQKRLGKLRTSPQYTAQSQALQHRLENLVLAAAVSDYSTESDREENPELGIREGIYDKMHAEIKTKRSSLGDQPNRLGDAALLKKRLDSLTLGMKESKVAAAQIRKEYKHMLSRSGDCSSRRSEMAQEEQQGGSQEKELCCQLCKATIRKIAAQVQAETEQWSQVQEILHHVREEMEELHKARDLWEDRALNADAKIATLQAEMHEWREKAHTYSNNVSELQSEISRLRNEIERVRQRHAVEQSRWLCLHSPSSDSDSDSQTKHIQIPLPRIRASKSIQNPPSAERQLSVSGKRSQRRVESLQAKENLAPAKGSGKSCMPSPAPLLDIGNTVANSKGP